MKDFLNVIRQVWRGGSTGQTPFPTRRIHEANEGTVSKAYIHERLNSFQILILSVKAKADKSEGGVQKAAAEPEG